MTAVTANAVETTEDRGLGINRREFLYYIMGASVALFSAQATGLIIWFLIPRFRVGQFGGEFQMERSVLPEVNTLPFANDDGRFWLVNLDLEQPNDLYASADENDTQRTGTGVAAIYKVCTHLGCIYDWNDATNRFECPCHGSKYRLDGRRIEDPAPRTLDRFQVIATLDDGSKVASEQGEDGMWLPLPLPANTVSISVDTGAKKEGSSLPLLCEITETC